MFAQKPPVPNLDDVNYREQLEYLYERRIKVNALIESLQEYERFRIQRTSEQSRQSA